MNIISSVVRCNYCNKDIVGIVTKIYAAPVLPGKSQVSFMSNYSHSGDACESCAQNLIEKMTKRQARKLKAVTNE